MIGHPAIETEPQWDSWGQVLEHVPGMLEGILSHLPPAQTIEEGNKRVLALTLWLGYAGHRNTVVRQQPNNGLENHPRQLAVCAMGQWGDDEDPTQAPSLTVVCALPWTRATQGAAWPHLDGTQTGALIHQVDLCQWNARILAAEQAWYAHHPETVAAMVRLAGDLSETPQGGLEMPMALMEGIEDILQFPIEERQLLQARHAWIAQRENGTEKEVPNPASKGHLTRVAQMFLHDPRFATATVSVSYHRPSAERIAQLRQRTLDGATPQADAKPAAARL